MTSNWEQPEPKWLVPELADDYQAEPFAPEPTPREIMQGSSIMDRLASADPETLKRLANWGTGDAAS